MSISEPIRLIISALICLNFSVKAASYYAASDGKYQDPNIWISAYPGNYIREYDTVYIDAHVELSSDVVVKGVLITGKNFSLTGSYNLVMLPEGMMQNRGIIRVKSFVNKGTVNNYGILESETDCINSGLIENRGSITVDNIFENTGNIGGEKGSIIANKRIVNKDKGIINGTMDLCSNQFASEESAFVDYQKVTYCGIHIFKSAYLTASLNPDGVYLKLHNSREANYKEYHIEKSKDGVHYTTCRVMKQSEVCRDTNHDVILSDPALSDSPALFYRLTAFDEKGKCHTFMPVCVGATANRQVSLMNTD